SLTAATPSGPFSAIRSAIATARPVTSPGGTTSFTRPRSYARPALIASPVSVISNAIPRATLVPRNVPPPAGNSPRFTSGSPNVASDDAMITSHPRSSSKPPASADAFAAPTRGTATAPSVNRRNARPVSSSPRPVCSPAEKDRRSMPAQKARAPGPVRTRARISGSVSPSTSAAPMPRTRSRGRGVPAAGRVGRATRAAPRRSRTSSSPTSDAVEEQVGDGGGLGERPRDAGAHVAGVGDQRDARDGNRGVAAQEHQGIGLLEWRRRLDPDLAPVVGAEAEPHVLVRLRERRVGRTGADGVDAGPLLEEGECLAGDVGADRLLHRHVVGLAVVVRPARGRVEVGRVEELVQQREVRFPTKSRRRGDEADRGSGPQHVLREQAVDEMAMADEVD